MMTVSLPMRMCPLQANALLDMKVNHLINLTNTTIDYSTGNCTFEMPLELGVCSMAFPNGLFYEQL